MSSKRAKELESAGELLRAGELESVESWRALRAGERQTEKLRAGAGAGARVKQELRRVKSE